MNTVKKVGSTSIFIVITLFISLMLILYYNLIDFNSSSIYWGGVLVIVSLVFSVINTENNYDIFIFEDKYGTLYKVQNYQIIEGKYYIRGYIKETDVIINNEVIKEGWIEVKPICKEKHGGSILVRTSWIIYILTIILSSL